MYALCFGLRAECVRGACSLCYGWGETNDLNQDKCDMSFSRPIGGDDNCERKKNHKAKFKPTTYMLYIGEKGVIALTPRFVR